MNVLCKHKYYLLKMQIFFEIILKTIEIVSKCKKKNVCQTCVGNGLGLLHSCDPRCGSVWWVGAR